MSGSDGQEEALVGTTLACAYQIIRPIGAGGMSAVYEAVQLRLNKRVAVKVMAPGLAVNEEALARFRREAEVTSHLGHPHLVTVMDFGTAPTGQPFLVMEYLEGADLALRIHELGRLPLETTVHIAKQVASAVGAAHDQGVVHRDLKPENVFLVQLAGEPDFVKVLDFGISKVKAARTQVTAASSIMGTPDYMAPEQATGMLDEIDHRTDQWALACMVWEMLSGRPPFAGDDVSAVFYQIIHLDPQPLGKRVPELAPAVEAVLRRALSKRVTDRFPSIRDFAKALDLAACTRPDEAEPVRVPRNPSIRGSRASDTSNTDSKAEQAGTGAGAGAGAGAGDRRMGHRGRRRVDAPRRMARRGKLRPIVATSIVAAGLVLVAVLALHRSNKPAQAAALPLATPRPAQRGEVAERSEAGEGQPPLMPRGSPPSPGRATDLTTPRPAQRGEVAERSEAGEGLPALVPRGSPPSPGGATDPATPRPAQRGQVAELSETGEGQPRNQPKSKRVGLGSLARPAVRAVKRTAVADAPDPFAPTHLASKAKAGRVAKPAADFVDPFGP